MLFSDGTGNSAAKLFKTNVWRLFEALDSSRPDQIAFYNDGVGTSRIKPLAMLGGAFGFGLKRNVIDLYRHLCRHYREDGTTKDEIFAFGFSRGAFTIRVLVGLVEQEGLVTYTTQEEFNRFTVAAYRSYRSKRYPSDWQEKGWRRILPALGRFVRDKALSAWHAINAFRAYDAAENVKGVRFRFVGVWDTVDAYGVPISELRQGIDRYIWPMSFGDLALPKNIDHARQALALDDERATFHPLVWDEKAELRDIVDGRVPPGRLKQVWFAGAHSNVGGGYPDDALSTISLRWMAQEATDVGLVLHPDYLRSIRTEIDALGRLYDSRSGLGMLYRYRPRIIDIPKIKLTAQELQKLRALGCARTIVGDKDRFEIVPLVHESVLQRMIVGTAGYAPLSMSRRARVITQRGQIMTIPDWIAAQKSGAHPRLVAHIAERFAPPVDTLPLTKAWDTVWWRLVVYWGTFWIAFALLILPLLPKNLLGLGGATNPQGNGNLGQGFEGFISAVVDGMQGLFPNFLSPWLAGVKNNPQFVTVAIGLFVTLYAVGRWLKFRIIDRVRDAWGLAEDPIHAYWRLESYVRWRNWAGLASVAAIAVSAALLLEGIGNRDAQPERIIAVCCDVPKRWDIGLIICLAFLLMAMFAYLGRRVIRERDGGGAQSSGIFSGAFLKIAASMRRENGIPSRAFKFWSEKLLPFGFATFIILGSIWGIDRALFLVKDSAGLICREKTGKLVQTPRETEPLMIEVHIKEPCAPSGFKVEEGHRYELKVTIVDPEKYRDGDAPADLQGVIAASDAAPWSLQKFFFKLMTPLRRNLGEAWHQPMLRIGGAGADEYSIVPREPIVGRDRVDELTTVFTARSSGEVFIYVNDAILGVWSRAFYNNNGEGRLRVSIRRSPPP